MHRIFPLAPALVAGLLLAGCNTASQDVAYDGPDPVGGVEGQASRTDPDQRLIGNYYERTASQGSARSKLRLANMHVTGNGRPVDHAKAAQLYKEAADLGQPSAAAKYGDMLMKGDGVPADPAEGMRYLEMGSVNKNGWSEIKLARAVKATDPAKARQLLESAAAKGNPMAAKELAKLGV